MTKKSNPRMTIKKWSDGIDRMSIAEIEDCKKRIDPSFHWFVDDLLQVVKVERLDASRKFPKAFAGD